MYMQNVLGQSKQSIYDVLRRHDIKPVVIYKNVRYYDVYAFKFLLNHFKIYEVDTKEVIVYECYESKLNYM